MRNSITIRRWRIDLYERALYLQKQPNPRCADCGGKGHVEYGPGYHDGEEPYFAPCDCWDPFHNIRIPVGRTVITERYPF
ncbi:hypothetical protein [Streptomyces sp. NPDC012888]|uniref:hypothetical protein n=1 Tax=Streptomyces sp. NPDC012888 TaxID=3364855 RepID=UPI0036A6D902